MQVPFKLTILGSSSATPTSERYPTAQVLNVLGRFFLIDCGEGTQQQLRRNRINYSKIDHICISHLHGDHFFGLIGLISTFILQGRRSALHIYAHSELQRYIKFQLDFLQLDQTAFPLIFHPLNFKRPQVIVENKKLRVSSFPLKHRIACCGFLFEELPREANIIKEKIAQYNIPIREIKNIKAGAEFITENGQVIPNAELTIPAPKPRSYAYCSDTAYNEAMIDTIRGVDLLYHEATFAQQDTALAAATFHSTGVQAAQIAKAAEAKKLLIGHFSARYKTPAEILRQARDIFPATEAVKDNASYLVE
ncbi:ribonuclease Z [Mangrovibacterium marinum]|uniref:Ribonuclease Z n=1 Tax=Mangrovibacterium marinum TaxID=1639118 RepID=A0A2T5BXY9_9BACT|nr:ribonuclease Z [Mangrovibacterium marinum]PTN06321.1 ribonuclease Z [Mangrovibacterium marinum]